MGEASDSRELLPALAELPGHLFWRAQARVAVRPRRGAARRRRHPRVRRAARPLRRRHPLAAGAGRDRSASAGRRWSGSPPTCPRQGLVKRVRNPDDRRSYALTRTPEGAAAARRWRGTPRTSRTRSPPASPSRSARSCAACCCAWPRPTWSPDTPEPLRESIGFLITRVHARMHREFVAALEPLRIEPRDFGSLDALRRRARSRRPSWPATSGVSGASMVQIVDDLEQPRAARATPAATDRRTQVLHLLPEAPARARLATALTDGCSPTSPDADGRRLGDAAPPLSCSSAPDPCPGCSVGASPRHAPAWPASPSTPQGSFR